MKRKRPRIAYSAAAVLVCGACLDQAPARSTTDCQAVYAESSDESWPTFTATLRTVFSSGKAAGEELPFGRIASLAADSVGNVYSLDAMNQVVFVNTTDGRFVRSFGRRGEGPGEFIYPTTIRFVRPDSVFVFDASLWRVSVYSVDGSVVRMHRIAASQRFGQVHEVHFGPDGDLYQLGYDKFQASLVENMEQRRSGVVRGANTFIRWDWTAERWQDITDVPGLEVFVDLDGGGIDDVPFPKRPLWAPAHGGLWYADSETYSVMKITAAGDVACVIRVEAPRLAVSDSERTAFYNVEDHAGDPKVEERLPGIRARRARIPVPATKPALQSLTVSSEGNLWVRRNTPPGRQARWDVFDSQGRALARGTLPADFEPVVIHGREIVGVLHDVLGVTRVGVLTISGAPIAGR